MSASRRLAIGASALAIIALTSLAWVWQVSAPVPPTPPANAVGHLFTVASSPLQSRLTILGTIAAGKTATVAAPFDGAVRERRGQLGDRVRIGDTILVMDAGDAQSRFREAEATLLKAMMAADVVNHWDTSADVVRAKRTLETEQATLTVMERHVTETKALLDKGIVSRNEYDGLVQQRDTQRATVTSNQQDLQMTLTRGSADNRRLADLDLANAQARLADLQRQVDGAEIRATATGILTRPPVPTQPSQPSIVVDPGVRVTRGQALYAIADTATLVVAGKVDEVDVNQVRVGQRVTISSDAFAGQSILGHIVNVSAEADNGSGSTRAPSFEVRAAFATNGNDMPRDPIRIGMSARMTIETRTDSGAIIVPVESILNAATAPSVMVRDPQTAETRSRSITIGATTDRGIEVLSGLKSGEVIVAP